MNHNCRDYALPSLCFSILPICRTPEHTNHQYFAMKAMKELKMRSNKSSKSRSKIKDQISSHENRKDSEERSTTLTLEPPIVLPNIFDNTDINKHRKKREFEISVDAKTKNVKHFVQPQNNDKPLLLESTNNKKKNYRIPTRESENLRRICRDECELLENELCQKEYAIAKRHPTIGKQLQLEDCETLPNGNDCSRMGIRVDVNENESCFWENGSGYRGTKAISSSGLSCIKWSKTAKEISNHPELAGHNYCRQVL